MTLTAKNPDVTLVATHPELNRIAVKRQIDAEYMLWLAFRRCVTLNGLSSHFNREHAFSLALEVGLSWSRRNFNRLINAGTGIFWGNDGERIYLRSFERVYKMLCDETAAANRSALFVEIEIKKSTADRRAELYWSWLYSRGEITISRDSLRDLFNLSHDQQRGYERSLGSRMVVHTNYCHLDADLYREQLENLPTYSFSFIQERFHDNKVSYITVVAFQLPNTYFARCREHGVSPFKPASKRAKQVTRTLYRRTLACGLKRRWWNFYDDWENAGMPVDGFIRTYFQGKKHVYRSGQYF